MSITVTRTKIIIPRRRADLLSRPRLTSLLDDLLDYKLLLVAAPAGYGKTSLLLDWAHQNTLPVCWYALDPLDQDLQRFIGHFIASISRLFPSFGRQSEAVLQSTNSIKIDLDRVIPTIVNEAYDNIKEHFAIVLDDFHTVDASDEVNDFISRFVDEVDENCHVVISSRTLVSFENLPLMVGRSMVKGLSYDELAFQADEIQALLKQNYQQTISAEAALDIEQATEGWITGLLLSAQTMWEGMTDRVRVARASGVNLYDYLAQQVLNQQSPAIRGFLLKSSLLEEFDVDLCQDVLGNAPNGMNWFEIIGHILHNNLFVLPVENKGTWLRYHHLFRDFLQAKIQQEDPESAKAIMRRLAQVFAERGQWEEAYEIYEVLGEKESIIHLVEQAGSPLIRNGQLGLLRKWLSAIPLNELNSNPALLSLNGGLETFLGNNERGLFLLDQAEIGFRAANDLAQLAKVLTRKASAHRSLGNYTQSLADCDEVLSIAKGADDLGDLEAEAFRNRGVGFYAIGELKKAIKDLEKALVGFDAIGDLSTKALTQSDLGAVYSSGGNFEQALIHYQQALDYWRQTGNITRLANLLNNLGVFYHLKGEYVQAGKMLFESLMYAQKSGYQLFEAYSLASLGDVYSELDAFEAASEVYQRAQEVSSRIEQRFLQFYVQIANAYIHLIKGDLQQADKHLKNAKKYLDRSDSMYQEGLFNLYSGHAFLAKEDSYHAIDAFKLALDCFEKGGQRSELIQSYFAIASAYDYLGELENAQAYLEQALQPNPDAAYLHSLVIAGRRNKTLLDHISHSSDLFPQVAYLIKQIEQFEKQIPEYHRSLRQQGTSIDFEHPPKLVIQTFGAVQVSLNGEPVTVPEWANQKTVRELFFLLLAHPDGLSKDVIGSILWPDSSPKQLKMQFKNALYRLRRALGKDIVTFADNADFYRFNRALDYEYDVEIFRRSIAQGDAAANLKKKISAYQKAYSLYKGSYLPDGDGTWVLIEREELSQSFMQTGIQLAQYALEEREYQAALEFCRGVLAQDPCQEEAHRLAMQAHAGVGNRSDLVRQFEICKNTLSLELGVSPSPQTEELYERLMA
jgi:LuxR family maltose regulon positive regulatory protein